MLFKNASKPIFNSRYKSNKKLLQESVQLELLIMKKKNYSLSMAVILSKTIGTPIKSSLYEPLLISSNKEIVLDVVKTKNNPQMHGR